jgi:hypothetical protein
LPPFLFSALVHIGDPDQGLTTIPVLCLCGGAALAALVESQGRTKLLAAAAGAAAVSAVLFFVPLPGNIARASTYRAVAGIGRITDGALSAIEEIHKRGRAVIIHYGFPVSYRQISYYFPDDYVVLLPGTPEEPSSGGDAWVLFHRKVAAVYRSGSEVIVPPGGEFVFLLPPGVVPRKLAPELPRAAQVGRVYHLPALPAKGFWLGSYRLAAPAMAQRASQTQP